MTAREQFEKASTSGNQPAQVGDSRLRRAISSALPGNVSLVSVQYLGRDNAGLPVYRIKYSVSAAGQGVASGYLRGNVPNSATVTRTMTFSNGKLGQPNYRNAVPSGGSGSSGSSQQQDDTELQARKQYWVNRLTGMEGINEHLGSLLRYVDNFKGSPQALNQAIGARLMSLTVGPSDDGTFVDPFSFGLGGGGGGGGGGFTGPEYVAPDRRVVEDMARGMMVSLLGQVDEDLVGPIADTYMADHRKNFDTPNEEIDPAQSMLEAVRNTEKYRDIHELRPSSEDERTWISQRRAAAARGGLNLNLQEDFAIQQATIAGDEQDVVKAAALEQTQQTGSVRGTPIVEQLRNITQTMFEGVQ